MSEKPAILILGGTGFVGRHLVKLLASTEQFSLIRAADKNLPTMAWFDEAYTTLFKTPPVEFKMANLANEQSVEKTFEIGEGKQFDYVVDLASTTDYGKEKEFYDDRVLKIVSVCGAEAKKRGVKRWIEVSTAQVYKSSTKPATETAALKPWTLLAAAKLEAENILKKLEIPMIILRPAIIYGPGDIHGIMPRLVCGKVYQYTNKEMKFLWNEDLNINTVHVTDVAKACHYFLTNGTLGEIYNLCDSGKTNQIKVNKCISEIFGIKTGFYGSFLSNLARINFKSAVQDSNDEHMQPWGKITEENQITKTPLSPYLEPELLYHNEYCIDGTKVTTTGFNYDVPELTKDLLLESLNYWISIQAFPPI
ncbi:NAD dependent epimerase/dehydratase, putative [Trichomonas vaginalis G3]|uniref:NAD dependent epimerase/dehydratase, putative n=1 Tax=Trichomonas vaginalis (strain ATCC PRA-98 / G3) TaxID=412133 RepID=A2EAJ7_TRIV3|nr:3-beta-hydroxy-delta5-steroid dehydrogenase protein [Trichomonas vaginalis G3]EAY10308.1 NAD dependent epimerase/dehydratase, putative [Trichomonas vaginalis G3]KAI5491025.1 3-beta-hydroxy-delta5-steroid dehydrogenase protein [Trichomonas vaginalis G3]|eukprot:XP_001322531.1 NAD dependent epimerase/dehydratase [Trichomonas vaginalis G3]